MEALKGEKSEATTLRGIPYEPEHIISVLRQHPAVEDATVRLIRDKHGLIALFAFVLLRTTVAVTISELRAFAKTKLYPQLVPDFFNILSDNKLPPLNSISLNLREQGFTPPRDATDMMLRKIWVDLLEKVVGIDDDFFAEGGHSLLAVDLLSRIEKATGQRLPLSTMLTSSTIRSQSDLLIKNVAPTVEGDIVEMQPGRGGRAVFFLHGDYTGGGFFSKGVARGADLDGPFMIVQPYGLGRTPGFTLPDSIEAIAEAHLKAIRQKQPMGPYRLIGHCNGGIIAFEIAQQLLKSNEKIEFLGMIDPSVCRTPDSKTMPQLPQKLIQKSEHETNGGSSAPRNEEEYRKWLRIHYNGLVRKYTASAYPGHLAVLSVSQRRRQRDPAPGWSKVAKNIAYYKIESETLSHLEAIQNHAESVGKVLSDAIIHSQGK